MKKNPHAPLLQSDRPAIPKGQAKAICAAINACGNDHMGFGQWVRDYPVGVREAMLANFYVRIGRQPNTGLRFVFVHRPPLN